MHEYIRRNEDDKVEEVKRALDGVDVDIKAGDFVAVLGHNGSGKSTFAKHVNALLAPTEGTLWVGEMDTKDESHIWDIRKMAGMVFQNPDNQIIGNIVEEDVGFGPENLGVPTDEIWKRVEDSLRAVGMLEYRTHSPNKLSGGQKQRVAIAGVIAMEPKCIVLDEPTAMLDPRGRQEVMKIVSRLNKTAGITVVLITHHMDEAAMAQRVVVLDRGQVAADGSPKAVFSQVELLHRLGLTAPETVELCWQLRQQGWDLPLDAVSIDECAQAMCLALGGMNRVANS